MLILKYVIKQYATEVLYFGIANVVANSLVMMRLVLLSVLPGIFRILTSFISSTIILWVSQNMEDDYTYNLAL